MVLCRQGLALVIEVLMPPGLGRGLAMVAIQICTAVFMILLDVLDPRFHHLGLYAHLDLHSAYHCPLLDPFSLLNLY